ncbi:TonB-dependent receptor [Sandaracinobacter sp.]|uniref:TonB-dependent receptor n=1 Tax=Sandaracinobacter sp. TaxID=2487581 RepID=UPI0035B0D0D0
MNRPAMIVRGARLGTAVALALAANAAWAQTTPAADGAAASAEDIVVTGFRASLDAALNVKRDETAMVDVIKATDIAAFPDTNLAESLQRIPGVTIDRDAGEGRQISVRGLGPEFTRVRLNGIEALATTGGTDSSGGSNRSRGFDFNVFASELFSQITVRKSASADVEEGSLGATVDLQTARPFDYDDFAFAVGGNLVWNDLSKDLTPRASALISKTFFDGKLGILVSGAYSKRKLFEEGFSSVRYDNGPSSGGFCSPTGVTPVVPNTGATCGAAATGTPRLPNTPANVAAYQAASSAANFHPRLPRYGRLTHDQQRIGLTGAIQFEPSDNTKFTGEILYADLKSTRQEDFLQAISFSRNIGQGGKSQTSVLETEYDANGGLLYGRYNGVDIRSESRFDELRTKFLQGTLLWEQKLADNLQLAVLGGTSSSRFRNPVQTTTTLDVANVNGYSIDFRGDDRLPEISYPFDVTSNSGAGLGLITSPTGQITGSEIRIRPQGATNTFDTIRMDLTWDMVPEEFSLKLGGAYKKYGFDTWEYRRVNQSDTITALPAGTTLADVTKLLTGFGHNLDLPANTPTSWLIPDLNKMAAAYDIYCNCLKSGAAGGPGDFTLSSITNGNARGNNRAVTEKDTSFYFQFDFAKELFGMPLRGNVGMRYVKTEQSATGYQAAGGGTAVTVDQTYEDWLPSMNLSLAVKPNFYVRFAAANVMARPSLGFLSPGGSISTTGNLTITSGNPYLQPFRATTFDASFEYYFEDGGLIGVGLFYKDIGTYVQQLRTNVPYNQTGLPLSLLPPNFTGEEVFQVTTPVNTEGGPLKGFEINWQQPFTFLPGKWANFGTLFAYTRVYSKIDYVTSPTNQTIIREDLIGLSPESWSGTFYYDGPKFDARVSASYRSAFLQRVPGQNNNDVEGKNSTLNVDFKLGYKLTEQLELTFEGTNLTDEFNDQFIGRDRNSPVVYHHTGRQLMFGARFTY